MFFSFMSESLLDQTCTRFHTTLSRSHRITAATAAPTTALDRAAEICCHGSWMLARWSYGDHSSSLFTHTSVSDPLPHCHTTPVHMFSPRII